MSCNWCNGRHGHDGEGSAAYMYFESLTDRVLQNLIFCAINPFRTCIIARLMAISVNEFCLYLSPRVHGSIRLLLVLVCRLCACSSSFCVGLQVVRMLITVLCWFAGCAHAHHSFVLVCRLCACSSSFSSLSSSAGRRFTAYVSMTRYATSSM